MDPAQAYLPALEATMQQVVDHRPGCPPLLRGMLRYHLGWVDAEFEPVKVDSGKRLRPLFLLLACEAQGGDWRAALPAAAAVELLHNFTLIHDDIEDRDEVRRGRPTLWTLWGVPQAINAGDALFALSYSALLGLRESALPPDTLLDALDCYTQTILHLTEGQCRDIGFEGEAQVSEASYLAMIEGKTAALLGLCCELGAIVAGAAPERRAALRTFGMALGQAFQMQDDLLGLWGDPAHTGKPAGADLLQRKKTLPIICGQERSPAFRAMLAQPALSGDAVAGALAHLEAAGCRDYVRERAQTWHDEALQALARAGGRGAAQATLERLAHGLIDRTR